MPLLPACLASTDLCNLDPFHPTPLLLPYYRDTLPSYQIGILGSPRFRHRNTLPALSMQIHSSQLCSDLSAPEDFPMYLQPHDMLSKLPLHLFFQVHNLALEVFLHIPPNAIQAP